VQGHVEIIKTLVLKFNADIHLPAADGITPLALALYLEPTKARHTVKTILELGASSMQRIKSQRLTSLQYAVDNFDAAILDLISHYDPEGFLQGLKCIHDRGITPDNALTSVIRRHDFAAAIKLLDLGAKAHVLFEECLLPEDVNPAVARERFIARFDQPIILAAENEMPHLVEILLAHGADPATSTSAHWKQQPFSPPNCSNLLDLIQAKIAELQTWNVLKEKSINVAETEVLLPKKESSIKNLIEDYINLRETLIRAGAEPSNTSTVATLTSEIQQLIVSEPTHDNAVSDRARSPGDRNYSILYGTSYSNYSIYMHY
jgi:ankyrin repeat protein